METKFNERENVLEKVDSNTAQEIGYITDNISKLICLLSDLEKRISPALIHTENIGMADEVVPTPNMCEIAMGIKQQGYRIEEATRKVNNMLDRLDI